MSLQRQTADFATMAEAMVQSVPSAERSDVITLFEDRLGPSSSA
ncbi:MAG: hypothetical protein ABEH80_08090 [Halobaculum sp.]|jgi:hypothetical protein